jgi:hypothetical protein
VNLSLVNGSSTCMLFWWISVLILSFLIAMRFYLIHLCSCLTYFASYRISYILLHANNIIKWSHTNTGTTCPQVSTNI